ncbi:MAG: AraC family transcriptional regulator [bacterium]|nr:AraC family transcriptional regulator [bacterium]
MENINYIRHGNHYLSDETDGYAYRYAISNGYTLESHLHNCYEFVYCTEGNLIYTVEGCEYFVSPGDMIFTRPNELHSFSFPESCLFERQFFHIYPNYIKDFPEIMRLIKPYHNGRKNYIPAHLVEQYELHRIFTTLKQCYGETKEITFAIAYACAILMMAKMNEILESVDFDEIRPLTNPTIQKILQYIDSMLTKKITLDDIAKITFLSPVYVSALFKKEMGMNITEYINMRRIVLVKNRILTGGKISSVYIDCGFNNYSTFYRAFSKYVKMSPDEFKRQNTHISIV